ncbi:MAG: hypothetical protein HOP07_03150 [Bacteriovoracaceae bacterium]|nr:hypothetical protein [Bacteriovoracaceae bacterium]
MVLKGPRTGIELKFFELTQKILAENNLELYEMEWHAPSGNLVVFIMNPETKTALLEDCVKIDRGFNPYLETESWIPENFTLEVSSPGLYRTLSKVEHFQSAIGEDVMLHLVKKIDEEKYLDFPKAMRNNLKIKVKLESVDDDSIMVDAKGTRIHIPFLQIKKANLETNLSDNKE